MKIDINLPPEKLCIICAALQSVYNSKAHTRRHKSTLSIALQVAAKIDSKVSSIKGKMASLFESKKAIKISLLFYEADMLELLLIDQIKHADSDFIKQQIQSVINILNQNLA